jgi:uncharacterized protein HemX
MLKESVDARKGGIVLAVVALIIVLGLGAYQWQHKNAQKQEEARMEWQRDREMGIPDTGLAPNATAEEKEGAKIRMLEEKMTRE